MTEAAGAHQSIDSSSPATRGVGAIEWTVRLALGIVLIVAIFFRLYALGRLPGVNGDEAWYGVQAHHWLSGEAAAWRTPNGNVPGPLHMGLVVGLESIFPPSFALLRIPAVISSLAAATLAYAIARRFFDRTTAVAAVVLMAVLPINIAYARYGWDPSHSALVVLAALYAALAGRAYLAALAFAFAIAVHPTNVFAAPFLGLAYFGALMENKRPQPWRNAVLFAMLLVLAVFLIAATTANAGASRSMQEMIMRLTDPGEYVRFPLSVARLLSGDTVLAYLTGEGWGAARPAADLLTGVVVLALLVAGLLKLRLAPFGRPMGLVAGWASSILFFFLLAGSEALQPHYERYGFVLVAPTVMMLAMLAGKCVPDRWRGGRFNIMLAVLALPLLAAFWVGYFRRLEEGRPDQHRAFWTGPVEPKERALQLIAADAQPGGATVVAEDWWLEWPIAYLADGHPLRVVGPGGSIGSGPSLAGRHYWVAYKGGTLDRRLAGGREAVPAWTIDTGYPGHKLRVWRSRQ